MGKSLGKATKKRPKSRSGMHVSLSLPRLSERLGLALGVPFQFSGRPSDFDLNWDNAEVFATSYLFNEIFSKYDDGKPSKEKEVLTWQRFEEAESSCAKTNHELAIFGLRRAPPAIKLAQQIIAKILGTFSWDECEPFMGWGPGASTRLSRRKSDAAFKFSGKPETTAGNAILGYTAICRVPLWKQSASLDGSEGLDIMKMVQGNRIVTVPKNFKTDRTIAIEPDMNMYVQKGIGGVIRHKLCRYGCDLNSQEKNQVRSKIASSTNLLATIDLSMASDTISREVVSHMLPAEWVSALEQSRSPFGVLPSGKVLFYQKFSSMGNGFTFELESLIFYALAHACTRLVGEEGHYVTVYGDDIIIPSTVSETFIEAIQYLGFKPNMKKTFVDGPFRESCGKHYFLGHDVTPFFVRKPVDTLARLFLLHNNLWRWNERVKDLIGDQKYDAVTDVLKWLRSYAPASWRKPRLPDNFGDGAFIGHLSSLVFCPHKLGWEFWTVRALSQVTSEISCELSGLSLKSLSRLEKLAPRYVGLYHLPIDDEGFRAQPSVVERYQEIEILVPQYPPRPRCESMSSVLA